MNEEINLELPTKGDITEDCLIIRSLVSESEDGNLSVGVSKEDTYILLRLFSLGKNEWMNSVLTASTAAIVSIVEIILSASPHAPGSLVKFEALLSLTETILSL